MAPSSKPAGKRPFISLTIQEPEMFIAARPSSSSRCAAVCVMPCQPGAKYRASRCQVSTARRNRGSRCTPGTESRYASQASAPARLHQAARRKLSV